jgi:hypothetical protein
MLRLPGSLDWKAQRPELILAPVRLIVDLK